MKSHPISNILPMMQEVEYQSLKESIKLNGLQVPIVKFENLILDGRHRFKACSELNIKPEFKDFHKNGISPLDFVIYQNLHRRHLTQSQKAVVALDYKDKMVLDNKKPYVKSGEGKGRNWDNDSYVKTAKIFGVGHVLLRMANAVRNKNPNLLKSVREGKMAINNAYHADGKPREFKPINPTHTRNENALSMIHKKIDEGYFIQLQCKKDSFQCHISGDGKTPIRHQSEWSAKPVFERFYEAVFSECKTM